MAHTSTPADPTPAARHSPHSTVMRWLRGGRAWLDHRWGHTYVITRGRGYAALRAGDLTVAATGPTARALDAALRQAHPH